MRLGRLPGARTSDQREGGGRRKVGAVARAVVGTDAERAASEGARLDVLEDEDGEAVVEALDARLLATETEREDVAVERVGGGDAEQSLRAPCRAEELRTSQGARARRRDEHEDEEDASEDEPACVTLNVEDPQVAMAIERTRLL